MNRTILSIVTGAAFAFVMNAQALPVVQYLTPADGIVKNIHIQGEYDGGVYAGLYNATLDGTQWQTYCIDAIGSISGNDKWTVDINNAASIVADHDAELFSYPGATTDLTVQKYTMISYLADQFYYHGNLDAAGRANLSLAFWEIDMDFTGAKSSLNLSNGDFSTSSSYGNAQNWLNNAFDYLNAGGTIESDFICYTPVNSPIVNGVRRSQEFIGVPEPGMLGLFMSGIVLLLGRVAIRRKKSI